MAFYPDSMTLDSKHTELVAIRIIFSNKIKVVNKEIVKRNSPNNNSNNAYYNEYGSGEKNISWVGQFCRSVH